jgi:hypothetical protein
MVRENFEREVCLRPFLSTSSFDTLQPWAEHRARLIFMPKSAIFDGPVAHRELADCLPHISVISLYFSMILCSIDFY